MNLENIKERSGVPIAQELGIESGMLMEDASVGFHEFPSFIVEMEIGTGKTGDRFAFRHNPFGKPFGARIDFKEEHLQPTALEIEIDEIQYVAENMEGVRGLVRAASDSIRHITYGDT